MGCYVSDMYEREAREARREKLKALRREGKVKQKPRTEEEREAREHRAFLREWSEYMGTR
jgi:hypothetical protein